MRRLVYKQYNYPGCLKDHIISHEYKPISTNPSENIGLGIFKTFGIYDVPMHVLQYCSFSLNGLKANLKASTMSLWLVTSLSNTPSLAHDYKCLLCSC